VEGLQARADSRVAMVYPAGSGARDLMRGRLRPEEPQQCVHASTGTRCRREGGHVRDR
jgi:hypothetical protein